jgi:hypothetical protein
VKDILKAHKAALIDAIPKLIVSCCSDLIDLAANGLLIFKLEMQVASV